MQPTSVDDFPTSVSIELSRNSNIRIRFDKGNGTVILNSEDYFCKLDDIVYSDKFEEVPVSDNPIHHPSLKTENVIRYYLTRYVKPFVSCDVFNSIIPNGSLPGAIYELAKVHKPNIPLRPVISMVGTAQYNLARYLDSIIKPVIPNNFMLSSTIDFVDCLSHIVVPPNSCLVSFDVVSLFTNVPLEETINLACDYVYSDSSTTKPHFDKRHFQKLLKFATSGEFLYKDRLFRQVDGVAMGSPLGPTLAKLFLAHYENQWMSSPSAPLHYFRYVDDIFCIFNGQTYADFFCS